MGFELFVPLSEITDLPPGPRLHEWLSHLDLDFYRSHEHHQGRADLAGMSNEQLVRHFMQTGIREGRIYNRYFYSFIDPDFYRKQYPDLQFKDNWEALRHWMYHGAFEKRVPNRVTRDLAEAGIHLFQMGKVGSRSVFQSLRNAGYQKEIPHLHWASEMIQTYPDCFFSYPELVNLDRDRPLLFICGIREPLDRVVSGLFQSTEDPKSSLRASDLGDYLKGLKRSVREFLEPHVQPILDWFDHGFYRGIDVYQHPFDRDSGYSIIHQGSVTVFLYRLDALGRSWRALSELTGLGLEPVHVNDANSKSYSTRMADAVFKLRHEKLGDMRERIESSRYWRHFFAS